MYVTCTARGTPVLPQAALRWCIKLLCGVRLLYNRGGEQQQSDGGCLTASCLAADLSKFRQCIFFFTLRWKQTKLLLLDLPLPAPSEVVLVHSLTEKPSIDILCA